MYVDVTYSKCFSKQNVPVGNRRYKQQASHEWRISLTYVILSLSVYRCIRTPFILFGLPTLTRHLTVVHLLIVQCAYKPLKGACFLTRKLAKGTLA